MSAVPHARGDLIAFADQDDVWFETKLELLAKRFGDPDVALVYHNAVVVDANLGGDALLYDAASHRSALAVKPMHPWHHSFGFTQMFRRSLTNYNELWPSSWDHNHDQRMAHDQWYIFLALLTGRVEFLEQPLALYRQHEANAVGARARRGLRQRISQFLRHDGDWERRASRAALARAEVAAAVAADAAGSQVRRIAAIGEAYRLLGNRLSVREVLWTNARHRSRFIALSKLMAGGAYSRDRHWTFGWGSLPRDFISCCCR